MPKKFSPLQLAQQARFKEMVKSGQFKKGKPLIKNMQPNTTPPESGISNTEIIIAVALIAAAVAAAWYFTREKK